MRVFRGISAAVLWRKTAYALSGLGKMRKRGAQVDDDLPGP
jgi:hypothetical protein